MKRRRIIIILVIVLFVLPLVLIGLFYSAQRQGSPEKYIEEHAIRFTRDVDTKEVIQSDPNKTPEGSGNAGVVVLGLEELVKNGVLPLQMIAIREAFGEFAKERLDGKYDSITVRPQDMTIQNGVFTTTLRVGQTDTLLPLTITAKNTGETSIYIDDPANEFGGPYDSGIKNITAD